MSNNSGSRHAQIKKRFEAVIKKAEDGDVYSMRLIAQAYSGGEYFPKDCFAAEAWLRKAADLGSDEAKKQLAKLLTESNGVAQDYEEAFDIYHDLMFDCDIDGMEGVGIAYKLGRGVPQNDEKASFYLKHAFNIALDLMESEQREEKKGDSALKS
jgi:TPR repeat protein